MPHALQTRSTDRIVGGLIVGVTSQDESGEALAPDHHAHLFISGPGSLERTCTGPIQVRVTVPKGYTHELVARDEGFGHGYDVRVYQRDPDDARQPGFRVEVLVPAAETVPIELEMIPDAAASDLVPYSRGRSNRPTEIVTSTLA